MQEEYPYGVCQYCNAKKVKNPHTGKIFCSKKCWLDNKPSAEAVKPHRNDLEQKNDIDPILILKDEITALRSEVKEMIKIMRDESGL